VRAAAFHQVVHPRQHLGSLRARELQDEDVLELVGERLDLRELGRAEHRVMDAILGRDLGRRRVGAHVHDFRVDKLDVLHVDDEFFADVRGNQALQTHGGSFSPRGRAKSTRSFARRWSGKRLLRVCPQS